MEKNPNFTSHDLVGICMDFFEAGGETVGSTLAWVLMYLALYPDIQEKCFEEINNALGIYYYYKMPHRTDERMTGFFQVQGFRSMKTGLKHHTLRLQLWKFNEYLALLQVG